MILVASFVLATRGRQRLRLAWLENLRGVTFAIAALLLFIFLVAMLLPENHNTRHDVI